MTWDSHYQNVFGISVTDIQPVLQNIGKKAWLDKIDEISNLLLDTGIFNDGQLVNCLQNLYLTGTFSDRLVDINTNHSESVLQFYILSGNKNDKFYQLLMQLLTRPVPFMLFTSFVIDVVRKELDIGDSNTLLSLMVYYGALTSVKINKVSKIFAMYNMPWC